MGRTSLVVRSLFLLGFVIAMPLLALPSVARWADEYLYGDGNAEEQPPAPVDDDAAEHDRQVLQAVLETPLESALSPAGKDGHGLDATTVRPPVMPPSPDFSHARPDVLPPASLSGAAPDRLGEIRQRLEDLGADYIRIEADSQTGKYHCQCRMLVAPGGVETETFEASGNDPTAVAEEVLRAIEGWRTSLSTVSPVQ